MNARLYDPVVGRFLSPDPYVQNPENTQNYNRYFYALNNPLKYTDPSGEQYRYNWFSGQYEDLQGNWVSWSEVYSWMNSGAHFVNPVSYTGGKSGGGGWNIGSGYYNYGYTYFNNATGQMRYLSPSDSELGTTLKTINLTGSLAGYFSGSGMDGTNSVTDDPFKMVESFAREVADYITITRDYKKLVSLPAIKIKAYTTLSVSQGNPAIRMIYDLTENEFVGVENKVGSIGVDGSVMVGSYISVGMNAQNYILDLSVPLGKYSSTGINIELNQQHTNKVLFTVGMALYMRFAPVKSPAHGYVP